MIPTIYKYLRVQHNLIIMVQTLFKQKYLFIVTESPTVNQSHFDSTYQINLYSKGTLEHGNIELFLMRIWVKQNFVLKFVKVSIISTLTGTKNGDPYNFLNKNALIFLFLTIGTVWQRVLKYSLARKYFLKAFISR